MRSNLTLAAIAAPVLALAPVALADLSPLADWNLIVRDSIVTSTSEVDGSAIVGGSVSGTTVFAVHNVTAPGHVGLALGGNINPNGISINNGGNLRIGGSVNGFRNLNGGGTQVTDNTVPAQLTSIFSQLASVSSYLNTLTPNGSIDGAGNMNAVPTNINGQLVAVYSFNQSAIQSLSQLNLNFGAAQSVIINISSAPAARPTLSLPPTSSVVSTRATPPASSGTSPTPPPSPSTTPSTARSSLPMPRSPTSAVASTARSPFARSPRSALRFATTTTPASFPPPARPRCLRSPASRPRAAAAERGRPTPKPDSPMNDHRRGQWAAPVVIPVIVVAMAAGWSPATVTIRPHHPQAPQPPPRTRSARPAPARSTPPAA